MSTSLLTILSLAGCPAADPKLDGEETAGTVDSEESGESGDTTGGESGDTTGGETGGDTGGETGGETAESDELSNLSWRLYEEVESVVYVQWEQSGAGTARVEYSFDSGVWHATPERSYDAGSHEQVVVGIPFKTDASWRVVLGDGESESGPTITTGNLDRDFPEGELTLSDSTAWQAKDKYLLTSINEDTGGWTGGNYWTFIIDREGRVVWAHLAPDNHWTLFAQVAVGGDHIMWDESTYWSDWDDGEASVIHRWYLDGELEVLATPGLHHEWTQLPDGTLAWGSQAHGGRNAYETLVEWFPGDPEVTEIWTCGGDWPGSGNCESNGIFYRPSTDSFLYSFYTNNSIVEVDRQSGESLWWAGDVDDGYAFDPAGYQYAWQHGISYTDAGTLLVSSEPPRGGGNETWLMEYEVDHEAQQLHYLWGCGAGILASTNGAARRLDNGNTLHIVGAAGVIREVDPDCNDVWRVDYHGSHLLGDGQFIDDLYALVTPTE